jgi:hypothetical protein
MGPIDNLMRANEERQRQRGGAGAERATRALAVVPGAPAALAEAGKLRVRFPEASLAELGRLADPPVTKGTMASRLRRLYELAARVGEVTEYGIIMSGGGFQVRNPDPLIERIYPVAQWIAHERENTHKVYRRRVRVIEDWQEVDAP